jgi:hypothetical protein
MKRPKSVIKALRKSRASGGRLSLRYSWIGRTQFVVVAHVNPEPETGGLLRVSSHQLFLVVVKKEVERIMGFFPLRARTREDRQAEVRLSSAAQGQAIRSDLAGEAASGVSPDEGAGRVAQGEARA